MCYNLTQYVFDALNRQTVTIDALNYRTTTMFDAAGNLTGLKDASNNLTTFAYDELNRKVGETDPFTKRATFTYNGIGLMTSTTDRLGRRRDFAYDVVNRLTTETWISGGSTQNVLTFTYDAVGNLLTAADYDGTYTMTYDVLDRTTVVKDIWGKTLTFTYDAVGNRTLVEDSFGYKTTSTFDAANRLTRRESNNTNQFRVDLTYNAVHQIESLHYYKDLAGANRVAYATYTYDAVGRLTSLIQRKGTDNSVIANYTYTYDAGGRLETEVTNGTTKTFTYDTTDQLTTDGTSTFTYDGTGNRTNTGYQTGTGNRLTNDGTWTYTYDDEGSRTKKSKGAALETWTYGYDNQNQLLWVEKRATDGGTLQQKVEFKYDVFGNRIEKKVDLNGDGTWDSTQRYAYDGWNPAKGILCCSENFDVWADLDGSNNLETRYSRGDVVDQIFARYQPDGQDGIPAWLLTDRMGSVRNVLNKTGVVKDTIVYDGFGNITSETDTTWGGRYKWSGRERDVETNLQYNRARYYDAQTGRWMSENPLGFDAGDSNLYRYAMNGPLLFLAPAGLHNLGLAAAEAGDIELTWTQLNDVAKSMKVPTVFLDEVKKCCSLAIGNTATAYTQGYTIYLNKQAYINLTKSPQDLIPPSSSFLGYVYNEAFHKYYDLQIKGKKNWAEKMMELESGPYAAGILADGGSVRQCKANALLMVEEAMSEIAQGLVRAIRDKKEPRLAKGAFGAPLHNDKAPGVPPGKWSEPPFLTASNKPVTLMTAQMTLWLMQYGTKDPAPGKELCDVAKALDDNWRITFGLK